MLDIFAPRMCAYITTYKHYHILPDAGPKDWGKGLPGKHGHLIPSLEKQA